MEMTVEIHYYASLREQRGCREEKIVTQCQTPRQLYEELCLRHGFEMTTKDLRVAINDEFSEWETPLCENDKIVFIPPVAGG